MSARLQIAAASLRCSELALRPISGRQPPFWHIGNHVDFSKNCQRDVSPRISTGALVPLAGTTQGTGFSFTFHK
jgi:hypothetical protein